MYATATTPLIDAIPEPGLIRQRLAHLMREQDLLRALLRVAERKQREQERQRQQGGPGDGA